MGCCGSDVRRHGCPAVAAVFFPERQPVRKQEQNLVLPCHKEVVFLLAIEYTFFYTTDSDIRRHMNYCRVGRRRG